MLVFVIDKNKTPLDPTHPARARKLLRIGRASVFKRYPFTIVLHDRIVEDSTVSGYRLKIDPGAKTSGLAILQGDSVVWAAEVTHRSFAIRDSLTTRSQMRRSRRNRKTRYRAARFNNRRRPKGWLAPSLNSRIENILTWVRRLRRLCPITAISQERVLAQIKKPLADAAAVNTTRWALFERLKDTGLPIEIGTGGQTKFNRTRLGLPKTHWGDALAVGSSTPEQVIVKVTKPLLIKATGKGHRRMCNITKFGFPQVNKKGELAVRSRVKIVQGFQTGDIVRAIVPKGKNVGTHVGRVTVRATGQFDISTATKKLQIINWKYCKPIHQQDGYSYA